MKVIVTQKAKYNLLDIFDYNSNISFFIRYIFSARQDKTSGL